MPQRNQELNSNKLTINQKYLHKVSIIQLYDFRITGMGQEGRVMTR